MAGPVNNNSPRVIAPTDAPAAAAPAPAAAPAAEPQRKKEPGFIEANLGPKRLNEEGMRPLRKGLSLADINFNLLGVAQVSGDLTVKALTKDNDWDPVRRQSGKVWNQSEFSGSVSGGSGPVRASSSIVSRVILPSDVTAEGAEVLDVLKSFAKNARRLASNTTLPFQVDRAFKKDQVLKLPGGAEFSVKFIESINAGFSAGASASANGFGASAGASVGPNASIEVARSVYRMPGAGHRVYAEVGETAQSAFGVSASIRAGAQDGEGVIGNQFDLQTNRKIGLRGSFGANISQARPFTIGGVFDLDDPKQAEAYEKLMSASALELKLNQDGIMEGLAKIGVGFEYAAERRAASMSASLKFRGENMLKFSRVATTETGQLQLPDGQGGVATTGTAQAAFHENLSGKLPMKFLGHIGSVDVRATMFTAPDGNQSLGAGMAKSIDVENVDQGMINRVRNMLTDLGVDTSAANTAKATNKKGHFDIEFAMNQAFFDTLASFGDKDAKEAAISQAYDRNFEDLHGKLPPWADEAQFQSGFPTHKMTSLKQSFHEAVAMSKAYHPDGLESLKHAYKVETNGRDLTEDLKMFELRNTVAKELAEATKDADTWGPVINAVGNSTNQDFLVLALTAHELGAPLVQFNARANGVELSAQPNLAARTPSIAQRVGELTSRWNN